MLLHDVFRLYLVYFLFVHSFDMFERFWTLNLPIIATVVFQWFSMQPDVAISPGPFLEASA